MQYPKYLKYFPAIFILIFIIAICLAAPFGEQQFSHLAQAFLHGHLNFLGYYKDSPSDLVLYHGQIFWALGPFPAIILMPFVFLTNLFNVFFYQSYLQVILVLSSFYLVYKIAKTIGYKLDDSLVLAFGFILGSAYIGIAAVSFGWYFGEVVSVFLSLLVLLEYLNKKRWWLIGIICGMLVLARVSAAIIIVFFILDLIFDGQRSWSKVTKRLYPLVLPIALAIVVLGAYNFIRFHNVLQQGYSYQLIPGTLSSIRSQGLFSIRHIPTNFYYAFIGGVNYIGSAGPSKLAFPFISNDPWGMSIFLTSPYLLYIFTIKCRAWKTKDLWMLISILLTVVFLMCWYATGWRQFGYRFSLDFLPLLFVLILIKYREKNTRLSNGMKFLLLGSGVTNFYLLLTFLGILK